MATDTSDPPPEAEAPAATRMPPYISFQTLLTFLKALKTDGLPPQIDKSVLSKLSGGVLRSSKRFSLSGSRPPILTCLRWTL